jgi:hypothetical protein
MDIANRTRKILQMALFIFNRILGYRPFSPAPFSRVYIGITHFLKLKSHPGTGGLIRSSAIENEFLVFSKFSFPFCYITIALNSLENLILTSRLT